jgi:hypothetical protein
MLTEIVVAGAIAVAGILWIRSGLHLLRKYYEIVGVPYGESASTLSDAIVACIIGPGMRLVVRSVSRIKNAENGQ